MTDKKISDLTAGTPPYDGATLFEASVPNGGGWDSRKVRLDNIGILSLVVAISSAQLLNCFTSPVTVIAAPGAHKMVGVIGCFGEYVFGTSQYDRDVTLYIGPVVNNWGLVVGPSFSPTNTGLGITQSGSNIAPTSYLIDGGTDMRSGPSDFVNQPILLSSLDKANNPANGDGSLVLTVLYRVIDTVA